MKFLLEILTIIGSLGIFLYGMILMSESLQKVAGKRIRKTIAAITSNKYKGLLSGTLITSAIQSSSATTVMVVSFVNAGLLSFSESIGVIMGANIGTTITPWVVSILGFGKVFNINIILLPLVALSMPFLFSGRNISKSWGEFIIGFAILFMGLDFLKNSVPSIDETSAVVDYIRGIENVTYLRIILFVGIGTLFTIIFQSSSAVMAFTFVIASNQWIPFEFAAAMVLGENIGTSITANIAAIVANISSKRAAFFHFFFNLIGVLWVLLIFHPILKGIAQITEVLEGSNPFESYTAIPIALAVFHSGFNITNSFLLLPFTHTIEKLLKSVLPEKDKLHNTHHLVHINSAYLSTSELSLVLGKNEIVAYAQTVKTMLDMIPEFLMEKRIKKYNKLYDRIQNFEDIIDKTELEIANYLTKISEGKLSIKGTKQIRAMLKMIDDIESMGDACNNMAKNIKQKNDAKLYFIQEQRNELNEMFSLLNEAFDMMINNLSADFDQINETKAYKYEERINSLRDRIKDRHMINIKEEKYTYQTGVYYIDIISQLEKMGDYIINVTQAIIETR